MLTNYFYCWISVVCCVQAVFRYKSKHKKIGALPIRIVKPNVSSVGPSSETHGFHEVNYHFPSSSIYKTCSCKWCRNYNVFAFICPLCNPQFTHRHLACFNIYITSAYKPQQHFALYILIIFTCQRLIVQLNIYLSFYILILFTIYLFQLDDHIHRYVLLDFYSTHAQITFLLLA